MNKNLIFSVDCSGSMYGPRGDAVNEAMRGVFSGPLKEVVDNPSSDFELSVGVLAYRGDNEITWLVNPQKVDSNFNCTWNDIPQDFFYGGTPTGAAILSVFEYLKQSGNGEPDEEMLRPVIVLLSDGEPNGVNPTYEEAIQMLTDKEHPLYQNSGNGKLLYHSNRVAIGINVSPEGRETLKAFVKTSKSLEGCSLYYDCTDANLKSDLKRILSSLTKAASF